MCLRRPYRSRGRTRLLSAGLARRSRDLGTGCNRTIASACAGGWCGVSEQPLCARWLCALAGCLVLTSAVLIDAPVHAHDPALASRQYMALTILMGRRNMPPFGAKHAIGFGGPPAVLSEAQIAAVINYVRSHFGNSYQDP